MAILHLSLTLDCVDLDRTAAFWSGALGFDDVEFDGDYALVRGTGDLSGVRGVTLQRVPEPKTVKNRMHLDLVTDEVAPEVRRLVDLGASIVADAVEGDPYETVIMGDPEGNEFCVIKAIS